MDIYGLVAELRSERMCMVQNLVRYLKLQAVISSRISAWKDLSGSDLVRHGLELYYQSRHSLFLHYKPLGGGRVVGTTADGDYRRTETHMPQLSFSTVTDYSSYPVYTDTHIENNSLNGFVFSLWEA